MSKESIPFMSPCHNRKCVRVFLGYVVAGKSTEVGHTSLCEGCWQPARLPTMYKNAPKEWNFNFWEILKKDGPHGMHYYFEKGTNGLLRPCGEQDVEYIQGGYPVVKMAYDKTESKPLAANGKIPTHGGSRIDAKAADGYAPSYDDDGSYTREFESIQDDE